MDYRPQVITLLLFYLLFIRNVRTLDYYTDDVFESKTHPDVYSPNVYPKFEIYFWNTLVPYDESKSEFVVRLQVHLSWIDERLATNQSIDNNTLIVPFEADAAHLMKLWRPSLYFSNSKSVES
ncbi:hypothetical protein BLOT_006131 [Blomia tropicalis]|nr:hypothetical protein BLOT_006131 [Blomia tropicalis]